MYVATRFFVWIIDRDANECYYMMLVNANQLGEQVMQKNSVNKSDARQKRMRLEK